jgi:hypothetical protein
MAKETSGAAIITLGAEGQEVEVKVRPLNAMLARDLVLNLTKSQLMKEDGTVIDTENIEELDQLTQVKLIDNIMDIVDTILLESGVVEVTLPKTKWIETLWRRKYVRDNLKDLGITTLAEAKADRDIKVFLYVRYIAMTGDDDFNKILNAALLTNT